MKHLHERMDEIFTEEYPWKHRTLRTLFDPVSAEWNQTTIEEKIDILRKILSTGEKLSSIGIQYKRYYQNKNRNDIANDFERGLLLLTEFLLTQESKTH